MHIRKTIFQTLINHFLWIGLAVLVVVSGVLYVTFNSWIMPTFTRYGEAIVVPGVINTDTDEAMALLQEAGLRSETVVLRKPNLPRNVVIDQNPRPQALVKPGRRIYLTVNAGDTTTVLVPNVESFPIREARSRVTIHGLVIKEVLPDSIPSPHANTITRQYPAAGSSVPSGSEVTLWFGTGLGDRLVSVPNITSLTVSEAREKLLSLRLRSVVVGAGTEPVEFMKVVYQGTEAGTSVREGYEVRLHLTSENASLNDINN